MLSNQDIKLSRLKSLFLNDVFYNSIPSVWYDVYDENRVVCLEDGKPIIKHVSERFLLEFHKGQISASLIDDCLTLACQHTISKDTLEPLCYKETITATNKERIFKGELGDFIAKSSVNYGFNLYNVPTKNVFLLPSPELFGIYAETKDRTKFGLFIFLDLIKKFTVN